MSRRTIGRLAIGAVVSLLALALLLRTVDVTATVGQLAGLDPAWLVLPLGALAAEFILRAQRWSLLLGGAGATVRTRRVMPPLAVAYFANAVLPARVGEVARTLLVARREQLPVALVAATVIIERVLDLAALLTLGLAAAAALGAVGLLGWTAIATGVVLVSGLAVVARFAGAIGRHLPAWVPTVARDVALQFLDAVGRVGAWTSLVAYGLSAIAWMGDVAVIWICAHALGIDVSLAAAAAISVGAALGTALPAASGYLGTYELGAVALGTLAGVSSDSVLAIAVLAHVFAIVPFAVLGLAALLKIGVGAVLPASTTAVGTTVQAEAGRT